MISYRCCGLLLLQVNPPGGTGEDGSVGIVVMGTGQDDKMRILCYDKAKAQIMAAGISGQLDVIPQHGLYLSLKDDAGAVWSIRFKSEEVMTALWRD